jgi:hypothetical protein
MSVCVLSRGKVFAVPAAFGRERLMPPEYELCTYYVSKIGPWKDVRMVRATLWSVAILSAQNPLIDGAITDRFNGLCAIGNDDAA